eukprot:2406990-Rhodomonas_salina.1
MLQTKRSGAKARAGAKQYGESPRAGAKERTMRRVPRALREVDPRRAKRLPGRACLFDRHNRRRIRHVDHTNHPAQLLYSLPLVGSVWRLINGQLRRRELAWAQQRRVSAGNHAKEAVFRWRAVEAVSHGKMRVQIAEFERSGEQDGSH